MKVCRRGHSYEPGRGGCRDCERLRARAWKELNREKVNAAERAKRAADPEAARAKWRKWAHANRERYRGTQRAYREANADRLKRAQRANYERNRERIAEQTSAWRKKNPEKVREYSLAWARKNRDKQRAWRDAHREYQREYGVKHYIENRERYSEKAKAWRRANPERKQLAERRRRVAKRSGGTPGVSLAEWLAICACHSDARGVRCAYCKAHCKPTIDHVVPVSRGGRDEPANVVPACGSCNSRKHAKLISEWKAARKMLSKKELESLIRLTEKLLKAA